uniref:G-protein coupled receptors family 1 profile domain-containing protein n=1 Tax=Plectus sambesii TaxID=2011161 RepID=A0A914WFU4_9BILA
MPLYHNRTDGQVELVVEPEVLDQTVKKLYIYGAEGIILAIVNIPILLMVAFFPVLRKQKEMIMVAGIAFADGFHGVALIVAAIGRISLITSGNGYVLRSRWQCLMTSWNLMFIWSWPLAPIMLLMISVDRFLAVIKPFKYYKFTNRYAAKMVCEKSRTNRNGHHPANEKIEIGDNDARNQRILLHFLCSFA